MDVMGHHDEGVETSIVVMAIAEKALGHLGFEFRSRE
jgi:hypothetical protein